jgi:hypothetical protein
MCRGERTAQGVRQDPTWEERKGVGLGETSQAALRKTEAPAGAPFECWGCGYPRHFRRNCSRKAESQRNGRQSSRSKVLGCLKKIAAVPPDTPLWVMLELQLGKVPALVDTGAQFSCVRSDMAEYLYLRGEPCSFTSSSVSCLLVDGSRSEVKEAVKLHVKLSNFSWDYEFKVLREGLLPAILGLDFLDRTKMVVDVASRRYSFGFVPGRSGVFAEWNGTSEGEQFLQNLCDKVSKVPKPSGVNSSSIVGEFPALFASTLDSEVYRCGPPKLAIFRKMVDELLEKGVVHP